MEVGVFVMIAGTVEAVMRAAALDVAQIMRERCSGNTVWRAFRVVETLSWAGEAEAILLDGVKNGVSFDWSLARGLRRR